jgi:hypothetical protein
MTAPDDCADIRIDLKTALPAQPVFLPTNAKNRLFSVLNTAFQAFQRISGMAPSAGGCRVSQCNSQPPELRLPVKICGASAGWTRMVAIFDDEKC